MIRNILTNCILALGLIFVLAACGGGEVGGVDAIVSSSNDSVVVEGDDSAEDSGFSQEQIETGKTIYQEQCLSCHGEDGAGNTALFVNDTDFDALYNTIQNTMPFGVTNDCIDDCATNVSAYLLTIYEEQNGGSGVPGEPGEGDTCDVSQWVSGITYSLNEQVFNQQNIYSCEVEGWCSSGEDWAYEPGSGTYWEQAWSFVSSCSDEQEEVAPIPVSSVIANATAARDKIEITWIDNSNNEIGMKLYRSFNNGEFTVIASLAENSIQYFDGNVVLGNTYQYQVAAFNDIGESAPINSNPIDFSEEQTIPLAPSNLRAEQVNDSGLMVVQLSWTDNSNDETSIELQRKTEQSEWQLIATFDADIENTIDQQVNIGPDYSYRIRTLNDAGASDYSNTVSITLTNVSTGEQLFNSTCAGCHLSDGVGGDLFAASMQQKWQDIDYADFNLQVATMSDRISNCDVQCLNTIAEWLWVEQWGYSLDPLETVPNAVDSVIANASALKDRIGLSWTDNADNETGTKLFKQVDQSGYTLIATLPENTSQYDDQNVEIGHSYQYQVTVFNDLGESSPTSSNLLELSEDPTAPLMPSNLTATEINGDSEQSFIQLSWQDNANNETSFELQRKTDQSEWQLLANINADVTIYIDQLVTNDINYFYRIRAVNDIGESDYSNTAAMELIVIPVGGQRFEAICSACHKPGGVGGDLFDGFIQQNWQDSQYGQFNDKVFTMSDRISNCDEECLNSIAEWIWVDQWNYELDDLSQTFNDRGVRGIRLLTPYEYGNSITDLTDVTIEEEDLPLNFFEEDFRYPGQAENGLVLYDQVLEYFNLAEKVAASFDLSNINCNENTCSNSSIRTIGRKVFRRPLTDSELASYEQIVNDHGTRDMFASLLISPNFLYRVELGNWNNEKSAYQLNSFEVATELSFKLWGTTPSDNLLDLAEADQLNSVNLIDAQVDSMIDDQKFAVHFVEFIRYYSKTFRPTDEKPGLSSNVIEAMKQEQSLATQYLLNNGMATINELFNPNYTFVNQELAEHYDISGITGSNMQRVSTGQNRGGLLHQGLTHILNSDFAATSLVKRGKMIRENMMCHLMGVPSGIDPDTIDIPSTPITTRERWNIITGPDASEGQCWSCHKLMNEPGSGLENFDQTGSYRQTESAYNDDSVQLTIDSSGLLRDNIGAEITAYNSARQLSQSLASEPAVRQCFADSIYRFSTGYQIDNQTTESFLQAQQIFEQQGDIKALVKQLIMLESVLYRTDRE